MFRPVFTATCLLKNCPAVVLNVYNVAVCCYTMSYVEMYKNMADVCVVNSSTNHSTSTILHDCNYILSLLL